MPPIVSVTINLDFLLFIFRSSYFLAYHHVKTVIFIDNRHIRYLVTECDGSIIRSFALAVSTIVGAVNNSLAALGGTALGYIAPLAVLCGCLMTRGVYLRKRVARFRQYTRQLRGRTYCQVKELADHIGKSVKFVAKDVRKMIRLGMFPEGRLDDQQSCLMLNDETYQQYVDAQEAHKQKMAQAKE